MFKLRGVSVGGSEEASMVVASFKERFIEIVVWYKQDNRAHM